MKKLLALVLILSFPGYAALSASVAWEVRQAGSNNNGGGFDTTAGTCGTDFSQQSGAQKAFTDLIIGVTTTQATSVAHPFASADVCNVVHAISGAGCTVGFFTIASVSGVTATFDRSLGTAASTCTANEGGALGTIVGLNSAMVQYNVAWIKADATYTITANQALTLVNANPSMLQLNGYTTARGDNGQFTIQATAGSFSPMLTITMSGNTSSTIRNMILDCNNQTSVGGLSFGSSAFVLENVTASNCKATAFNLNNNYILCHLCRATGGSGGNSGFIMQNIHVTCYLCQCDGMSTNNICFTITEGTCYGCIATGSTGATADCYQIGSNATFVSITNSVAYGCARDGFRLTGSPGGVFVFLNNLAINNTGVGLNNQSAATIPASAQLIGYTGLFGNGTARTSWPAETGDVTLTGDPFTNAAGLVFTLNSTAGRGAALQAAGTPGAFFAGTGYMDIGPLQVQAVTSAPSGSPIIQ